MEPSNPIARGGIFFWSATQCQQGAPGFFPSPCNHHLSTASWVLTGFSHQPCKVGATSRETSGTETAEVSTEDPWVLVVSGGLEPEATFKIARSSC